MGNMSWCPGDFFCVKCEEEECPGHCPCVKCNKIDCGAKCNIPCVKCEEEECPGMCLCVKCDKRDCGGKCNIPCVKCKNEYCRGLCKCPGCGVEECPGDYCAQSRLKNHPPGPSLFLKYNQTIDPPIICQTLSIPTQITNMCALHQVDGTKQPTWCQASPLKRFPLPNLPSPYNRTKQYPDNHLESFRPPILPPPYNRTEQYSGNCHALDFRKEDYPDNHLDTKQPTWGQSSAVRSPYNRTEKRPLALLTPQTANQRNCQQLFPLKENLTKSKATSQIKKENKKPLLPTPTYSQEKKEVFAEAQKNDNNRGHLSQVGYFQEGYQDRTRLREMKEIYDNAKKHKRDWLDHLIHIGFFTANFKPHNTSAKWRRKNKSRRKNNNNYNKNRSRLYGSNYNEHSGG